MKKYTFLFLLFVVFRSNAQSNTNYKIGVGSSVDSIPSVTLDSSIDGWIAGNQRVSDLSPLSLCQIILNSAVGTDSQSVCLNAPIVPIVYSVSDSGATVAGLPSGINGVFNANVFTITGSSSVSGVFNYTVSGTGNCSTAVVVFGRISNGILIPLALPFAIAGGSQSICPMDSATVSGASASSATLLWTENGAGNISNGATTLTPVYTSAMGDAGKTIVLTMTVSRNNICGTPTSADTARATYTVNVNPIPTATMKGSIYDSLGSSLPQIIFTGKGGSAPYIFSYSINGGSVKQIQTITDDSIGIKIPFKIGDTYAYKFLKVEDANGCYSFQTDSISFVFDPLSISKFNKNSIGEFYPNPFNDQINVVTHTSSLLKITDINGKEVYTAKVDSGNSLIKIENIDSGIYFITIINNQGSITKKIFKN